MYVNLIDLVIMRTLVLRWDISFVKEYDVIGTYKEYFEVNEAVTKSPLKPLKLLLSLTKSIDSLGGL